MEDIEQTILELARTYNEPDVFIRRVEESFRVPLSEKGVFFSRVGLILYER